MHSLIQSRKWPMSLLYMLHFHLPLSHLQSRSWSCLVHLFCVNFTLNLCFPTSILFAHSLSLSPWSHVFKQNSIGKKSSRSSQRSQVAQGPLEITDIGPDTKSFLSHTQLHILNIQIEFPSPNPFFTLNGCHCLQKEQTGLRALTHN